MRGYSNQVRQLLLKEVQRADIYSPFQHPHIKSACVKVLSETLVQILKSSSCIWVKQPFRFSTVSDTCLHVASTKWQAGSEWLGYSNRSAEAGWRKIISDGECCPPHWRHEAKFKCLLPAVESLWNTSLLAPSSKSSSVFPRSSNWLDLLKPGASSVEVTNCQCSSKEENIKQKPSTCSKGRRVFRPISIIRWGKDMFRQPESISIGRSRSTYLSLSSAGARICSVSLNPIATSSVTYDAIRAKSKFTLNGPCNGGAI